MLKAVDITTLNLSYLA